LNKKDRNDIELQVAAVILAQQLGPRSQAQVAKELSKLFNGQRGPDRGAFDNARVSHLLRFAVDGKLARPPSTVELIEGDATATWQRKFEATLQSQLGIQTIQEALDRFCATNQSPTRPRVIVVPGSVERPRPDQATSEYAGNAARTALQLLQGWVEANKGPLRLGMTWGAQLHYVVVAANNILTSGAYSFRTAEHSVMPLVGLPLGGRRTDILSSSEIAHSLAKKMSPDSGNDASDDYDLQLVPAYLPETEFSDNRLSTLYHLLNLTTGWSKIFGSNHMTHRSDNPPTVNAPAVYDCNFIWSSVSDIGEPFGFTVFRQEALFPFARGEKDSTDDELRPAADCGGIPLWDGTKLGNRDTLEASFRRRWTGIRRSQWQYCVRQGTSYIDKFNLVCGAVLFAPTAAKAKPVLYAIRDGLVNILILGQPCAAELMRLLSSHADGFGTVGVRSQPTPSAPL